jgi:hypothetical protein
MHHETTVKLWATFRYLSVYEEDNGYDAVKSGYVGSIASRRKPYNQPIIKSLSICCWKADMKWFMRMKQLNLPCSLLIQI